MKANDIERNKFDKALDVMIELFNNLEDDIPVIQFHDDVLEKIALAKKKYGDPEVNDRINKMVMNVLSWLDLDAEPDNAEEDGEEEA
jgi:Membrane-integrating protein Mistic